MKAFLILQLRPEDETAESEYRAMLEKGDLQSGDVRRIRLDQAPLPADLRLDDYAGVIVGGGPGCVSDPPAKKSPTEARIERAVFSLMPKVTKDDFPFLGCCYGIGILGHHLGGRIGQGCYSEPVGVSACRLTEAGRTDPLLAGLPEAFDALVGHKEALETLPKGCAHLVASDPCPFQMVRYRENVYATQFHPEGDGEGFELRIRVYRNKGYFPPEDADRLTRLCRAADIHAPEKILRNFVERYRQ